MENCLDSATLIRWLNGSLEQQSVSEVEEHIGLCDKCRRRLEELTGDPSIEPPDQGEGFLSNPTFTNEPHFQSLRQRLGERVANLLNDPDDVEKPTGTSDDLEDRLDAVCEVDIQAEQSTIVGKADLTGEFGESYGISETLTEKFADEGFRLERLIGEGGFAKVYQAWETKLGRNVAIKVLERNRGSARNRHRFLREAKSVSGIQSPHVVKVLSAGETSDSRPYIVMEWVKGISLSQLLDDQTRDQQIRPQGIEQSVKLLLQVCEGLATVHAAGLVHRDIKPGNIFVDVFKEHAKLGDFGLARILSDDTVTLTQVAELAGTPAYMSPEQAQVDQVVDSRSDVYSLGATLYHCLTGQPPFRGSSLAILKQVIEVDPTNPRTLNEEVSRDLETICLKAMDKLPSRRYSSAIEFSEDLTRAINGQPVKARPVSSLEKLGRWASQNSSLAAAMSLLFLSLVAGTITTTSLWLNSQHNAEIAESRARSLEESKKSLTLTQMSLIDSVKKLVSNSLSQKSAYLQMTAHDRQLSLQTLIDAYDPIFESVQHDPELIRELALTMVSAADVNLELRFQFWQTLELVKTNQRFVDRLIEFPDATERDYAIAARVYNQLGECLSNVDGKMATMKAGEAGWKSETNVTLDATAAFFEAKRLSAFTKDSPPVLVLEHFSASMMLASTNEDAKQSKQTLLKMLAEIEGIRQKETMSAEWMGLHQRVLRKLSALSEGQAKVDFRMQRRDVLHAYVDQLYEIGQETYWYDRTVAVNDFFLGVDILRSGNTVEATPHIAAAVNRLNTLVETFPLNLQFHADLAEAYVILANVEWNDGKRAVALATFDKALEQFEANLKIDSDQIGFRRRVSRVHEMVSARYLEMGNSERASESLDSAIRHIQAVISTKAEMAFMQSDEASLTRLRDRQKVMAE